MAQEGLTWVHTHNDSELSSYADFSVHAWAEALPVLSLLKNRQYHAEVEQNSCMAIGDGTNMALLVLGCSTKFICANPFSASSKLQVYFKMM